MGHETSDLVTSAGGAVPSYPSGVLDSAEPSGKSPPKEPALPGFALAYVNDFTLAPFLEGWGIYEGVPGGDPGGQFGPGHVSVSDGLLRLSSWSDAAYGGSWVTGGLCHCGLPRLYGAYFVRTRTTGPGPTVVELLWPANNQWPPEIDFAESDGGVTGLGATVHWSAAHHIDQRTLKIDLTHWHTFGLIWTPGQLLFLVDGREWGSISRPSEIPTIPMTLDLQQQTWCLSSWACPSSPQQMQVDWVAEYKMTGPLHVTVGPFGASGNVMSAAMSDQVAALAADVSYQHCSAVTLLGYGNPTPRARDVRQFSLRRAKVVRERLAADLAHRNVSGVTISIRGMGATDLIGSIKTTSGRDLNRRVVGTTCAAH